MDDITLNEVRRVIRRANFRLKAEEYESAFSLFEKALQYIPDSVEIMNILGTLAIKLGDTEDGIRYYRDSSVIKEELYTQIELGFALIENNQIEEAHEIFTELDISDPEVKAGLGISLVLQNQELRNASDLLAKANKYEMGINTPTFLGLAYYQLGQYNNALTEFRKKFASWENTHAIGVQYLGMNSLSTAYRNFNDALRKYEQEVGKTNVDEIIVNKLHFDTMLSEIDPNTRIQLLVSLVEGGKENLEVYLAIIATLYEISEYNSPFTEYVKKAMENLEADQGELRDQLDIWFEKGKEAENSL